MKPVLTDRIAVILIVAGLVLWACCMPVLWGWAFNPSGTFSLRVVLLILGTAWFCLWRRKKLAQMASRTLKSFEASDFIPFDAGLAGKLGTSKQDVQQRMKLLAAAGLLATVCFIFSTLAIPAFAFLTKVLGERLLLSSFEWSCVANISLLIAIFPLGLGFAAIVFASNIVRSGSGRDTYAACYRDWLWAIAVGFAAFGVAWWFGANLIVMVFAVAAVIMIVSLTAVSRMELATHPRRRMLPFGPPEKFTRLKIVITHAAIALILILQVRMLGDIFALSMTRRMVWIFLSISMLVYFLGRVDRKSRPPSKTQAAGAILGIAVAATAQATEFILCLSLQSGIWIVVLLGIATQIPMTALMAMVISQQRRLFAIPGGTAGRYFTSVSGGIAVAVLGYILFSSMDAGLAVIMWIAVGTIIVAGLNIAKHRKDIVHKREITAWSLILAVSMVVGAWITYSGVVHSLGKIQPGAWLSNRVEAIRGERQFLMRGVLPQNMVERSQDITDCLAGIFQRRKGRWWIVASNQNDLPDPDLTVYSRISRIGANPQPPSVPKKYDRWPPLSHSYPNSFRSARLDLGHVFYDGVFLAPMAADHPQAWRCYNQITMLHSFRHSQSKNADGHLAQGIAVLRTQTSKNHVRNALEVAKTFYGVVKSGWAIVAIKKNGLDMLLVGPDEALTARYSGGYRIAKDDVEAFLRERTRNCDNVFLVPLKELWKAYDVEEIELSNPPGEILSGYPTKKSFQNHLEDNRKARLYNQIRDD